MEPILHSRLDYRTSSLAFPFSNMHQTEQVYRNFGYHFFVSFQIRSFTRPPLILKIAKQDTDFTVSYLIDSCRLDPETAALASQKLHLQSPDRPDSVIALLRNHGFTKTQISDVVRRRPLLLLANPAVTLLPKLKFFHSIGVSETVLARTVAVNPTLLTRSLEKQIIPTYNFFKSLLHTDEKIIAALKRSSWIFLVDHRKNLIPNVEVLREAGVPDTRTALLLTHFPEALMQRKDEFGKIVSKVKEMGFNPTKSTFVLAIHALSGGGNKLIHNRCVEVYRRWGWSEDDILYAFKKHPQSMLLSEDKITNAMDFLVNKMGWPSEMIVRCPVVLFFSFEKRIKPRCSVAKVLLQKGLVKKSLSLSTFLFPDEEQFMDRFVNKYLEQVPDLLSVYGGKLDYERISI